MHIYHFTGEVLSTGGLYEEIKLNKENFSNLFDDSTGLSKYENAGELFKNNKRAWYHCIPQDFDGYPYMLLLQKDGSLCIAFADLENGTPTRVRYIYELEYPANIENGFDNSSTELYDLGYSLQVIVETYEMTTQFPDKTENFTFDVRNGTKGNLLNGTNFEITECDLQTGRLTIQLSGTALYSTSQVEPTNLKEIVIEQGSDGITLSDNGNKQFFTFRFIETNQNHDELGSR